MLRAEVLCACGENYKRQKDYLKAAASYKEAAEQLKPISDFNSSPVERYYEANLEVSHCYYLSATNYQKSVFSKHKLVQAIPFLQEVNQKYGGTLRNRSDGKFTHVHLLLGWVYYHTGNYDLSYSHFRSAHAIYSTLKRADRKWEQSLVNVAFFLAAINYHRKHYVEAIFYAKESFAYTKEEVAGNVEVLFPVAVLLGFSYYVTINPQK